MKSERRQSVALIVAHPDDETLWAGGTILSHPLWECFVVCLTGGNDNDKSTRFKNALKELNVQGIMGDLEDGAEQHLLNENEIENTIQQLLPVRHYDLIITHNSKGEYTRHNRHEEVFKAVVSLWQKGEIFTTELWTFAYEDDNARYFPKAVEDATIVHPLPEQIWQLKYYIMTEVYGYGKNSWEVETTPTTEAFWQIKNTDYKKIY